MDDLNYGTRDKRGNWTPDQKPELAPIWHFPPQLHKLLKWLPGYFLPYNLLYFLTALAWWHWVVPDVATLQTLAWPWVLRLLIVNAVGIFIWHFAFDLRLYMSRAQGQRFKYNPKFPADHPSNVFWFNSQKLEGMLRTFLTGVPIWTALQVGVLWLFANGYVPWIEWAGNPVYLACLTLAVPLIHELHFYAIHRLIHIPVLYKYIHSVHHNSVNPSPWSSLSMHWIEQLLYFATIIWHIILPSNPMLALYQINYAAFAAIGGHIGFEKVELGDDSSFDTHGYVHYLHHKYFEVNYADTLSPLDKLFGSFHDGSKQANEQMKARFKAKKARQKAKA